MYYHGWVRESSALCPLSAPGVCILAGIPRHGNESVLFGARVQQQLMLSGFSFDERPLLNGVRDSLLIPHDGADAEVG